MTVSLEIDNVTRQILAVYVQIRTGSVARTVEIEEDACYVDEDADGTLLGVEILDASQIGVLGHKVSERYSSNDIDKILEHAKAAFA